jgi:hypothetical protein
MLEFRSRLGRLYMYSKDNAFTAQENFTTEALRMAIADDRQPMFEALSRVDAERAAELNLGTATSCRPSTQVALPGGGWLDLVIEILDGHERVIGEVWVEVKIDAPESGLGQLPYYQECAQKRALERGYPVWLVTLARHALPGLNDRLQALRLPPVPNVSWNVLYQCARHGRPDRRSWKQHASWQDLGTFLEEQNVANDALGPISDREAASLEPSYELIQKVSAVVTDVHKKLPELFPESVAARLHWVLGQLLNYVGLNFRANGEMVGEGGGGVLTYGLMAQDGTAYWKVVVGAGGAPHHAIELAREKAGISADLAGADWTRSSSGSSIAVALKRATTLETHDDTVAWFEARLCEVAGSEILNTLLSGAPLAAQA